MNEITPRELAERMKSGSAPIIIDVREPFEYAYAHIEGAQLKPLGEIRSWAKELDKAQAYVMQCHTGSRSFQAASMLERMGFKNVSNLVGGIDAWSRDVDPNVPKY